MKVRIDDNRYDRKQVSLYKTETPDEVAEYALQLIEKHAMVAGIEDGEDSTGRAKLRIQTPQELVTRSFAIAELAFEVARQRGHMTDLPDLNEINADYDAERQQKKREQEQAKRS